MLLVFGAALVYWVSIAGSASGSEGLLWVFLAGVIGVPAVAALFMEMPATNVTSNVPLLIVAGLLVGFGTRLGSGCTSGHGVCGMSRFSLRSIVATLIYIGAGILVIIAARGMGVL